MLALMTALFGVFGWGIINYQKIDKIQGLGMAIGTFIVSIALIFVIIFLVKEIKRLGGME